MKYVRRFMTHGDKPKVYHLHSDCRYLTNAGDYIGIEITDEKLEQWKIKKVCKDV